MAIGRPTTCTLEIAEKVAESVRLGRTLRCSAGLVGVHWSTFKLWLTEGEKGKEPYATFLALTRAAEAYAEAEFTDIYTNRAKAKPGTLVDTDGAKLALGWLERRRWKDWWREKNAKHPRDPSLMTDEELKKALKKELRILAKRTDDSALVAALERADDLVDTKVR